MKQTVFRKVYTKDRLPSFGQRVIALVLEQNELGLSKYLWNVIYDDISHLFILEYGQHANVEYWLEEVELPSEDEIRETSLHQFSEEEMEAYENGANYILNKLK